MNDVENLNQAESANDQKKSTEDAENAKKVIRLVTVAVYLVLVSTAAIILSLYYLFFWNPTVHPQAERLVDPIHLHFSPIYFNVTQKETGTSEKWNSTWFYASNKNNRGLRCQLVHVLCILHSCTLPVLLGMRFWPNDSNV